MEKLQTITTDSLSLIPLNTQMASLILELVNTPAWLEFIGQRNVQDLQQAHNYIQSILDTKDYYYWAIAQKDNSLTGIISLIKRESLEYYDIGFAVLPQYTGKGLAFQGAYALIDQLKGIHKDSKICAITDPNNHRSIALLNKLGFNLKQTTKVQGQSLLYYIFNLR